MRKRLIAFALGAAFIAASAPAEAPESYTLADNRPFWGSAPWPPGGGVYPRDLTKEALDAYLAAHPGEREALTSPYTVVHRQGARPAAAPPSVEYRQWLEPAAKLLE